MRNKTQVPFTVFKIGYLILFLIFTVFPLYWITITSLKPQNEIFTVPARYWPETLTFENYRNIFEISRFHVYISNSLLVSALASLCVLVISILSAYVLARYHFRGKKQVMLAFFMTQMIPIFIALVPLYRIMGQLELTNRLASLILMYTVMMIPFSTIMLKGFFERIPGSLEEAAIIDGCTHLQALRRVIIPVMLPGIAATFIFSFVQCWNELFLSVMFIDNEASKTVPVAMNSFITKYDIDWGAMSAATVLSVIPTFVLFALAQRFIVEGLTDGAVKG